jgi:DNA-binding MarR family transcriptional regulator
MRTSAARPESLPDEPSQDEASRDAASQDAASQAVQAVRAVARVSRVLERSSPDLTLAHYRVLAAVAAGEGRATRVAEKLALGKPTVSAAVESLCERGLLLRREVEEDQRAAALALTAAGEIALNRVEDEMVARIGALCARTPDPARALEALAWLGPALDEAVEDRIAASRRGECR